MAYQSCETWMLLEDSAFGSVAEVLTAFAELDEPFEASSVASKCGQGPRRRPRPMHALRRLRSNSGWPSPARPEPISRGISRLCSWFCRSVVAKCVSSARRCERHSAWKPEGPARRKPKAELPKEALQAYSAPRSQSRPCTRRDTRPQS